VKSKIEPDAMLGLSSNSNTQLIWSSSSIHSAFCQKAQFLFFAVGPTIFPQAFLVQMSITAMTNITPVF